MPFKRYALRASPSWESDPDPVLALARQELQFYSSTKDLSRFTYRAVELASLATASATVIAAGVGAPSLLTACVAGVALFVNGFRQVFDPGGSWVRAAYACSELRRALNVYLLLDERSRDSAARQQLADEIDRVSREEFKNWGAHRRRSRELAVGQALAEVSPPAAG